MMALRPLPVAYTGLLDRAPMLGRARLSQGYPPQQQASPQDNLAQNGAILQVTVSPPSASGQPGQSQTFTAMIDSGASISCITIQGAQAVGLPQVSSTQLGGVGGMTNSPVYGAALTLPQYGVNVDPVQIAGVANPLPNVDMLIGRDILRNLTFNYVGSQGAFTLTQAAPGAAPIAGAPAPVVTSPVQGQPGYPAQPIPTQPMPGMPAAQVAPPPPPPAGNLPQPPASSGGSVLGMHPAVAAGVGAGILAVGAGALHLFKVI